MNDPQKSGLFYPVRRRLSKKAMEYAPVLEALGVEDEVLPLSLGYQMEVYRIQTDLSCTPLLMRRYAWMYSSQ
jgi:hypothetical protein